MDKNNKKKQKIELQNAEKFGVIVHHFHYFRITWDQEVGISVIGIVQIYSDADDDYDKHSICKLHREPYKNVALYFFYFRVFIHVSFAAKNVKIGQEMS